MAGTLDGQLWFVVSGGINDIIDGHINSDGSGVTTTFTNIPANPGAGFQQGGTDLTIGFDLPAGLYFVVNSDGLSISVHSTSTGALLDTLQIGDFNGSTAAQDIVNSLVVDPINEYVYVGRWGETLAESGVVRVHYDPLGTANNILDDTQAYNSSQTRIVNGTQAGTITDVRSMDLSNNNQFLYYTDNDNQYALSPFSPTNAIFRIDLSNTAAGATKLSDQVQFPTNESNGYIGALTVDDEDNIIYFTTHQQLAGGANTTQDALWWMPVGGGTATKITLPAGALHYAGEWGGLSYDHQLGILYISDVDDPSVSSGDRHIIELQMSADGKSVTNTVNTFTIDQLLGHAPASTETYPQGTSFDQLPILNASGSANTALSATTTHAAEQGAAITLLTAAPNTTDIDGDHLASATVKITGGTFSANETSANDDHLTVNHSITSGKFTGTNITGTFDSATETLTLSGYDTIANYDLILSQVQYFTTGDNPTNYGLNNTRTITWQVNDGAIGNPGSTTNNQNTTTITIDAQNDAPDVNTSGGGNSASMSLTETNSAFNTSRSLTIADPDSLTETLTLTNFSHTGPSGSLTDTILAGYFSVPSPTNITQATGSASFNWTFNSGTEAFNFLAVGETLTLNYTIHDVDSNNSNSPTSTSLSDDQAVSVTISGTNDAPTVNGGTQALNAIFEDSTPNGQTVSALLGSHFADVDDNAALTGVAIVSGGTSASGKWQWSTDGSSNWTDVGSATDASAVLIHAASFLRFVPATNFNGSAPALSVRLVDDTQTSFTDGAPQNVGTNGGTTPYSSGTVTLNLSVTGVNDAPNVVNGATQSLNPIAEDPTNPSGQTVSALFSSHFSDADDNQSASGGSSANNFAGVAVVSNGETAAEGKWQYSTNGTTWTDVGTSVSDASALLLDSNALIRFLPTANFNGTAPTLGVRLVDDSAGAITTGNSAAVSLNGDPTPYSATTVSTSDTITATNDPVGTVAPGAISLAEDSVNFAVTGLSISDVDANLAPNGIYEVTLSATHGTMTLSTLAGLTFTGGSDGTADISMTFHGTLSDINTALGTATYTPDANYNGFDAQGITLHATDEFGGVVATGTPGSGTSDTNLINVTVTAVNDTALVDLDAANNPASNDFATLFTEDGSAVKVTAASVSITDIDDANMDHVTVTISNAFAGDTLFVRGTLQGGITSSIDTSVSGKVTLTLSGTASKADYADALQKVFFANTASSVVDLTTRDVTVSVNDGHGDGPAAHTLISITPTADGADIHLGAGDFAALAGTFDFNTNGIVTPRVDHANADEDHPRTAALDDGGFVMVWTQSTGTHSVLAQRFQGNGDKTGDVITVAPEGGASESSPYVTALPGRGFAVTWVTDANDLNIAVYGNGGDTPTASFMAGSVGAEFDPTISTLSNGNLLVTWEEHGATNSIFAQRFATNGTALDPTPIAVTTTESPFHANINPTPHQTAALANGGFAVTWVEAGTTPDLDNVKVQTFDSTMTPGAVVTLNEGSLVDRSPDVALLSDGRFVVVWESTDSGTSGLLAQFFTASGAKQGAAVELTANIPSSEFVPQVSGLADGGFVVNWLGNNGLNSTMDVRVQTFNSDGSARTAVFNVTNTGFTPNVSQQVLGQPINEHDATVTTLNDGHIVVSWVDPDPALQNVRASQDDILYQVFDHGTGKPVTGGVGQNIELPTSFALYDGNSESLDVLLIQGGITNYGYHLNVGHDDVNFQFDTGPNFFDQAWVIDRHASDSNEAAAAAAFLDALLADPANTHIVLISDPGNTFVGTLPLAIETIVSESSGAQRSSFSLDLPVLVTAAPVLAGLDGTPTFTENAGAVSLDTLLTLSDSGASVANDIQSATVKISSGFFTGDILAANAGGTGISVSWDGVNHVLNLTGPNTLANYEAVLESVTFNSASDNPTNSGANPNRTIQYQITDVDNNVSSASPLTLSVIGVNDAPDGADKTVTTDEDTPYVFTALDFGFSDPLDSNSLTAVKISSLPSAGTLKYNGTAITSPQVTAGFEVTAADIAANKLTFAPAADDNGIGYASFTFQVRDNGGTTPGVDLDPTPNTITIDVTALNDAPINTVPGAQTSDEDTPLSITGLQVNDVDIATGHITVTLSVSHGTIHVRDDLGFGFLDSSDFTPGTNDTASVTFSCDIGVVNATLAALDSVVYTPNANYYGSDTLTMLSDDGGATGSGGTKSDTDPVTITINAVNDPVTAAASATATVAEDGAVALTGLSISDVDASLEPGGVYSVTLSASHGALTLSTTSGLSFDNGTANGNGTLTFHGTLSNINAALATASYAGAANYNGSDTVAFSVSDTFNNVVATGSGSATNDARNIAVTVLAGNDPVTNTAPANLATNEDVPAAISGLSISDVDAALAPNGLYSVTLSASHGSLTLSTTSGLTFDNSTLNGTGALVFHGTLGNLNAALATASYAGAANFNGADSIAFSVTDTFNNIVATGSGLATNDARNIAVTVNAVNDAPVIVNGATATLAPIDTYDSKPAGETVSSLLASHFSDAADTVAGGSSANLFAGIAISGDASTLGQGHWQFSTNGGASWSNISGVSNSHALLLDATAELRFVSTTGFTGAVGNLSVHLADNSQSLVSGDFADLSVSGTGGTTQYSAATVSVGEVLGQQIFAPSTFELADFGRNASAGSWTNNDLLTRVLGDVNGDGLADIIGFGQTGVFVSLATGGGHFAPKTFELNNFGPGASGWGSNDFYDREVADVNGDGRADIVGFGQTGVYVSLASVGGHFAGPSFELANFAPGAGGWSSDNIYHRELADVNHDGKADIVAFGQFSVWVSLASGNGHFATPINATTDFVGSNWNNEDLHLRKLGDVDGDGNADIIGFGQNGVSVALGTGDGHFMAPTVELANFTPGAGSWISDNVFTREIADVNGDGLADIVGFGQSHVWVAFATGQGHFAFPVSASDEFVGSNWLNNNLTPREVADVTGDHRADIVAFGPNGVLVSASTLSTSPSGGLSAEAAAPASDCFFQDDSTNLSGNAAATDCFFPGEGRNSSANAAPAVVTNLSGNGLAADSAAPAGDCVFPGDLINLSGNAAATDCFFQDALANLQGSAMAPDCFVPSSDAATDPLVAASYLGAATLPLSDYHLI